MLRLSGIVLAVVLIGTGTLAAWSHQSGASDAPTNVIKYRQTAMRASASHITNIFSVLKGDTSFVENIGANARAISDIAVMIPDMFPAGSGENDTAALPAIWQDWAKFEAFAAAMKIAADKVVAAVEKGNMAAVDTGAREIGKSCGSCHEPFRKKK